MKNKVKCSCFSHVPKYRLNPVQEALRENRDPYQQKVSEKRSEGIWWAVIAIVGMYMLYMFVPYIISLI